MKKTRIHLTYKQQILWTSILLNWLKASAWTNNTHFPLQQSKWFSNFIHTIAVRDLKIFFFFPLCFLYCKRLLCLSPTPSFHSFTSDNFTPSDERVIIMLRHFTKQFIIKRTKKKKIVKLFTVKSLFLNWDRQKLNFGQK